MLVVMVLALALVTVRLVDLQAVGSAHYAALARKQSVSQVVLPATRGAIFDRFGHDLAISVPRQSIYVDPSQIRSEQARTRVANALAPVLGIPAPALLTKITRRKTSQFEYLARQVPAAIARRVKLLGLAGVGQVKDAKRIAPAGTLAGPIVGFAGIDNQGLGGIEKKYDETLKGVAGSLSDERDPRGREISPTARREVPAQRGRDLVLTLDASLQYLVEQQLTAEVEKAQAKAGMAAIVDVRTGDVVAMANIAGRVGDVPAHPAGPRARNRLLTDTFEPGSTAKVATIASALESGVIDLDTRFSVPSSVTVGGQQFPDDEDHARENWTVREILARSSNVGTIQIADKVRRDRLDRTMRELGFGFRTDIQFPGERFGQLPALNTVDPSIMGSMPIGYGIATTPMQTLGVFTTVANGGRNRPARLVAATIDANGVRHDAHRSPTHPVLSAKTASELNELLRGVVANGTGVKAAIPGYTVAGKTGTARKIPYTQPYTYMASFAGFAPAESPRFSAIVVLDEPKGEVYGGAVAAPVFSSIMQSALRRFHVPPTAPVGADAGTSSQVTTSDAGNVSGPVR